MHEATQISYGYGVVNIIMNSESATEIPAPDIRFGDYKEAVKSCFTDKELREIEAGGTAELTFDFVMIDEPSDASEVAIFDEAIQAAVRKNGILEKGVYFEAQGSKTIGDGEVEELSYFFRDVEFQIDIPLYLVRDERDYYTMIDIMGECQLEKDIDKDADTITIATNDLGTTLILYKDTDSLAGDDSSVRLNGNYIILAGIVALVLAWFSVDRLHRKERTKDQ